ncbi:SDR family NAD(P)-dependent oxidoreductase [Nonomuraea aurantiaca]|uniref:SDR family NAD(P)-dependent oxidoreductase n=1 Tax=Nonomuraea aurantiaca TaxID=2878562 RepID=UPI001CD9F02F|nr:SDR family NAD(P)-dependent oxidoreductase [Nonomuraea aurantiaca]MCA2220752.1 SDR family NAD(P)-dependent oxidoreductase [Nonomuraea aurantiaca]
MKTVLVTGASSGIGLATAIAAAQAGFTTLGTVRRPDGDLALREAAEQAGLSVDVVSLELTDPESVHDCIRSVIAMHGRLDALVNNAGILGVSHTVELNSMENLRASMEVNFFGAVAMSRAAMPHLRATGGRLITISSVRGVIGQPFNEAYSAAKFAIEGFMEGLAPVAAEVGVSVSLIEPAAVLDTAFIAGSGVDPAAMLAMAGPYADAYRAYRKWVASRAIEGAQVAREVAEVVVRTLTDERPAFRVQTSEYGRAYVARKLADPDGSVIQELTRSWVR